MEATALLQTVLTADTAATLVIHKCFSAGPNLSIYDSVLRHPTATQELFVHNIYTHQLSLMNIKNSGP